jgi:hypothetical protein
MFCSLSCRTLTFFFVSRLYHGVSFISSQIHISILIFFLSVVSFFFGRVFFLLEQINAYVRCATEVDICICLYNGICITHINNNCWQQPRRRYRQQHRHFFFIQFHMISSFLAKKKKNFD